MRILTTEDIQKQSDIEVMKPYTKYDGYIETLHLDVEPVVPAAGSGTSIVTVFTAGKKQLGKLLLGKGENVYIDVANLEPGYQYQLTIQEEKSGTIISSVYFETSLTTESSRVSADPSDIVETMNNGESNVGEFEEGQELDLIVTLFRFFFSSGRDRADRIAQPEIVQQLRIQNAVVERK
jgi:hypothetical protein